MIFGPDKMLYVSVGDRDGSTRDDNSPARKEAQNLASHIGKILRLRDDGSIPPDNPFVKDPKAKGEIFTVRPSQCLWSGVSPANRAVLGV